MQVKSSIIISKIAQKFQIMEKSDKQYIWHCPRKSCNAIVLKTARPFLSDDGEIVCKKCNEMITFEELFEANKHNIKKYLQKG